MDLVVPNATHRKTARLLIVLLAMYLVGAGAFVVVTDSRHERMFAVVFGTILILVGAGLGLWAWRRNWSPPGTPVEYDDARARAERMNLFSNSIDLLLFSVVLCGLLFPGPFAMFSPERGGAFWIATAFALLRVGMRAKQRVVAIRAAAAIKAAQEAAT